MSVNLSVSWSVYPSARSEAKSLVTEWLASSQIDQEIRHKHLMVFGINLVSAKVEKHAWVSLLLSLYTAAKTNFLWAEQQHIQKQLAQKSDFSLFQEKEGLNQIIEIERLKVLQNTSLIVTDCGRHTQFKNVAQLLSDLCKYVYETAWIRENFVIYEQLVSENFKCFGH